VHEHFGKNTFSMPEFDAICEMVRTVKSLGLETCVTLGMVDGEHAARLKTSGLDYYNRNADTSPDFCEKIVSTRTIDDRIKTIEIVQNAEINVCSGGIVGMGETNEDRVKMLTSAAAAEYVAATSFQRASHFLLISEQNCSHMGMAQQHSATFKSSSASEPRNFFANLNVEPRMHAFEL